MVCQKTWRFESLANLNNMGRSFRWEREREILHTTTKTLSAEIALKLSDFRTEECMMKASFRVSESSDFSWTRVVSFTTNVFVCVFLYRWACLQVLVKLSFWKLIFGCFILPSSNCLISLRFSTVDQHNVLVAGAGMAVIFGLITYRYSSFHI